MDALMLALQHHILVCIFYETQNFNLFCVLCSVFVSNEIQLLLYYL